MNEQQRKVSLLDALCHSIESILSINSTAESIDYAVCSLKLILGKYQEFINGEKEAYKEIMIAADYAGKAINISKTTIGHAMSYTLTSEYGIKHGQAVAICLIYALKYIEQIYDLKNEFIILYNVLGIENGQSLSDRLSYIYNNMKLECNYDLSCAQADVLAKKVNAERLMNFIVPINEEQIKEIYSDIIRSKR
jgi:alcohol dehydrogenase class IV